VITGSATSSQLELNSRHKHKSPKPVEIIFEHAVIGGDQLLFQKVQGCADAGWCFLRFVLQPLIRDSIAVVAVIIIIIIKPSTKTTTTTATFKSFSCSVAAGVEAHSAILSETTLKNSRSTNMSRELVFAM